MAKKTSKVVEMPDYAKERHEIRAFIVRMSNKSDIPIDADEVEKVYASISTGNPAWLRRGIMNPSFFIAVVEDKARVQMELEELDKIVARNNQERNNSERPVYEIYNGMKPLKDIFKGLNIESKYLKDGDNTALPQQASD